MNKTFWAFLDIHSRPKEPDPENKSKTFEFSTLILIFWECSRILKIDSFTGMIGSGPAYFFYLLKSYEKKLNHICNGDKKLIKKIIVNLLQGVAISVETNIGLNDLIKQVASKKGTTEAGLNTFKKNKLNKLFEEGIESAIKRSKEISSEHWYANYWFII